MAIQKKHVFGEAKRPISAVKKIGYLIATAADFYIKSSLAESV